MSCSVVRGDTVDTVQFSRSGVSGELQVRADRFELTAQLGFLLGAFSHKIEREITRNLDSLLESAAGGSGAVAASEAITSSAAGGKPIRPVARAAARRASRKSI